MSAGSESITLQSLQPKCVYPSLGPGKNASEVSALVSDVRDDDERSDAHDALLKSESQQELISSKNSWLRRVAPGRSFLSLKSSTFGRRQPRDRGPSGWRYGARLAAIQAGCIFLANLAILIWAAVKIKGQSSGPIFQGSCDTINSITIAVHLGINVLSTALLGASNYIMQSLCAPTRAEVDKAHEKGIWLQIGQQSLHNLRHITRWKTVLWVCLAISSLPLHLFYNSVFYSALSSNEYIVTYGYGPDITEDNPQLGNGTYDWKCANSGCPNDVSLAEFSQYEPLSASDCLKTYAQPFLSDRGNVTIIGNYTANGAISTFGEPDTGGDAKFDIDDMFYWICSMIDSVIENDDKDWYCNQEYTKINTSDWHVIAYIPDDWTGYEKDLGDADMQVQYCISEKVEPKCRLEFNLPLLGIVVAFNAFKLVCTALAFLKMTDKPLVTIGDAVASFMTDPDPSTRGMCLASSENFKTIRYGFQMPHDSTYTPKKIRLLRTSSKRHWTVIVILFLVSIGVVLGLLGYAIINWNSNDKSSDIKTLWSLGLGKTTNTNLIQDWAIPESGYGGLVAAVLVSNSPQLILSFIYVIFNSLCTNCALAVEWSRYSLHRKSLRVSTPQGHQRSTYFLQIPYRFGLPMLGCSAVLHWLVSQSIFLARVNFWNGQEIYYSITTCGYSPIGMIFTSIVGAILLLTALGFGFFKHLNGRMPLVAGCSAAISAACHAPAGDSALKPVKWGVVPSHAYSDSADEGALEHISFSSGPVEDPLPGSNYA